MKYSFGAPTLFAVGLLLCTDAAHSQTPQLQVAPWIEVLSVQSWDAPGEANAVTAALVGLLSRPRQPTYQLGYLASQAACRRSLDTECLARISQRLDSDQFIWGNAKHVSPSQVSVELHMFSRGEPQRYTQFLLEHGMVDPSNQKLMAQVRDALRALVTRGTPAVIRLQATTSDGQVLLDGRPATDLRDGHADLVVRGGEHTVQLRVNGATTQQRVFVQPGTTTALALEAPAAGQDETASNRARDWHVVAGWTGIGLGALFAGLGTWSSFKVSEISNDSGYVAYRAGMSTDACWSAKSGIESDVPGAASPAQVVGYCDRAETYRTLQPVFWGLSGASVAAGLAMLLTAPRSAQRKVGTLEIVPYAAKSGGSLAARVAF